MVHFLSETVHSLLREGTIVKAQWAALQEKNEFAVVQIEQFINWGWIRPISKQLSHNALNRDIVVSG